jgi:hypothetical protein
VRTLNSKKKESSYDMLRTMAFPKAFLCVGLSYGEVESGDEQGRKTQRGGLEPLLVFLLGIICGGIMLRGFLPVPEAHNGPVVEGSAAVSNAVAGGKGGGLKCHQYSISASGNNHSQAIVGGVRVRASKDWDFHLPALDLYKSRGDHDPSRDFHVLFDFHMILV